MNKTNETKKTVVVKHRKSFANTKSGQAVDTVISTALVVGTTIAVSYAANRVMELVEEKRMNKSVRNFMSEAKEKFEEKYNK